MLITPFLGNKPLLGTAKGEGASTHPWGAQLGASQPGWREHLGAGKESHSKQPASTARDTQLK